MSIDREGHRLLDLRGAEEEAEAQRARTFKDTFKEGAPEIPEAQLVFSPGGGMGVAIRGSKFVCHLPKGYSGPGLELALIDRGRYIVTFPDKPPLLVNPQTGVTSPL